MKIILNLILILFLGAGAGSITIIGEINNPTQECMVSDPADTDTIQHAPTIEEINNPTQECMVSDPADTDTIQHAPSANNKPPSIKRRCLGSL